VTAKEKLLEEAPRWTDAQATAALRVVEAQAGMATYLEEETELSAEELDAREDHWAEANAHEAINEEPW
jgi:hypothetical protein